ncbi:MAG: c-type cytochrome [Vulcanimicrobiota bacterium]
MILLIGGAAVFFSAYRTKTAQIEVPEQFKNEPGVVLFYQHQCVTCHTVSKLPNSRGVLGPGLDDVGNRSRKYDPEHNGEEYLRESILEPAKVVHEGFINGMPSFKGKMTEQELESLVQWLLTLREEKPDA